MTDSGNAPHGPQDRRRSRLQRGVIILPSAFTLGNLFFGVYAMVAASRGDFMWAGWFIVFAASLDLLDGRIARFTRTGSEFGGELDSLVDAVSFGVAPAFIVYSLHFSDAAWSWLLPFAYIAAVVVRLARFNVEQGGRAKTHFYGLPSPTAGMILATSYPFTQTPLFQEYLSSTPWDQVMGVTTVLLAVLMLSHIPYRAVPKFGFRSARGLTVLGLMLLALFAALTVPRYFFFLLLVLYTSWGLLKAVIMGLLDRLPERDPLVDLDEDELEEAEDRERRSLEYGELAPSRFPPGPDENPRQAQEEEP